VCHVSFSELHECSNRRATAEPVELRRPVIDVALSLAGGFELPGRQHAAPERILVHGLSVSYFVHALKVEQRKRQRQQLKPEGRVVELPTQLVPRHAEDVGVVEGKRELRAVFVYDGHGAARLSSPWNRDASDARAFVSFARIRKTTRV